MRPLILTLIFGFALFAASSPTPPKHSLRPPLPPGFNKKGKNKKPPPGNGRTGASAAGGASSGASAYIVQAQQIGGIPPMLNLTVSNGQLSLHIVGTTGATVAVQSTANLAAPFSWTTLTNVALTGIAPTATEATPGRPQDAIDLAYVPAAQTVPLPATTSSAAMQFFRVVMPYDYVILAGMVLPAKGCATRLIAVNMPGLNDDGCYVSQAGSFIHYNQTTAAPQLVGSGPTIRQIATALAKSMNLDWTTASEFTYSNGMGQILATVVETDPAALDPVAGQTPTSPIVIDF